MIMKFVVIKMYEKFIDFNWREKRVDEFLEKYSETCEDAKSGSMPKI